MIAGLVTVQPPAQASEIRITISIKIMIKFTFSGIKRPTPNPPEAKLSPLNVKAVAGETRSNSVDITWSTPLMGAPKNGYTVELASINKTVLPENGRSWTTQKYDVGSAVNELRVIDLDPSSIYEVMITAKDDYGSHDGDPVSFCSPKFYSTDAGCISLISASKANYVAIPDTNLDPGLTTFNVPNKVLKNGAISVTWSAASNVSSYVVQWLGQQNVNDYGEKSVPAGETSTIISGLPGNHLYYIRVLALGSNGGYSESPRASAYASPGGTGYPELSGSFDTCLGIGDFIILRINSQTPENQVGRLVTKGFLTRFRKQGETIWLNADQVLKDGKRCFTTSTYPDPSDLRRYFLPDAVSNYEFQVSEVSVSPTNGTILGDWSYSRWYGPNALALNKAEVEKLGPSNWLERDAFLTRNTNAIPRFKSDQEYRVTIEKLRDAEAKQEAEAKIAAELKAKQEAEAKIAAELKAKQEAEAKIAAELKAKQEAEEAAAVDKAAADLLAQQKAAAAKAAATKKTTITCIKGKLTKKVTAIKPKCPSGYKLKK